MKKILLFLLLLSSLILNAQKTPISSKTTFDERLYTSVQWRSIGPYRGGRSCTVTGVPGKPNLFYFGGTGGGVWKTTDAGKSWANISDGFFGGSIGAVAVSESDNNVIYVGGGEQTIRGNVSHGFGIWKSDDAGRTWKQSGLKNSRQIGRVRVHPKNADLVYVAAMGNAFADSDERGVYRSKDGGKTWERILFVNNQVGAVDLNIDPSNPRILYASTWRFRRTGYSFSSGGQGSGLWKSIDGGDNWTDLSKNEGFPKDTLGIIGVSVSPVNSDKVYAMIEAKDGGAFCSDDGGKTWKLTNGDNRELRQRAWYYTRIYADTKQENTVYVMNVGYSKSTDGGTTWKMSNAPHGDHHDLWIDPNDNQRMIIADDGGAQVSTDGGASWTSYLNQPTAQFYRVATDNSFPYRILVAQQDNSAVRIKHRSDNFAITQEDWDNTAGGESAHLAADPLNPDIVYGGSYGGDLSRKDHSTGFERAINVFPENPIGHGGEQLKYRFQWNAPIFFSPHNPKKLYTCSQFLHVSYNEGQTWETISPDLTTNDRSRQKVSGGPITKDNTGVEIYCTVFAAVESPRVKDLIWAGSDDGIVHLTKDGGKNWTNITPKGLPAWTMVNCIEADPFNDGGAYLTATSYKSGDLKPYIYRTKDFGATWTKITDGIDNEHFTRVCRADPKRQGLLYAGTESGMYISFDDGASWKPFQLNLPIVPIADLAIKDNNLIAATHGRSVWLIDDLTVLHQLDDAKTKSDVIFYQPKPSYRTRGGYSKEPKGVGQNHPNGVIFNFFLKEKPSDTATVKIALMESNGKLIREYSTKAKEETDKITGLKKDGNTFVWNMRYPDAKRFEGLLMWAGSTAGATAAPGNYKARLTVGKITQEVGFQILKDPRVKATDADILAQSQFIQKVNAKTSEIHETITQIRDLRKQLEDYKTRLSPSPTPVLPNGEGGRTSAIIAKCKNIDSLMTNIEETLYQTKLKSQQDMLNFPIKINDKLAGTAALASASDDRPTDSMIAVANDLITQADIQLNKYKALITNDIAALNKLIRDAEIDAIQVKKP